MPSSAVGLQKMDTQIIWEMGSPKLSPTAQLTKRSLSLRIPQFPLRIYETLQTTVSAHLRLGEGRVGRSGRPWGAVENVFLKVHFRG